MKDTYLALFGSAYAWSARHEFDSTSSLYSSVLYLSGLQYANVLALAFLLDAAGIAHLDVNKWIVIAVPLGFCIANGWWAFRNKAQIVAYGGSKRASWFMNLYLGFSLIAFIASVIAFIVTAPDAPGT